MLAQCLIPPALYRHYIPAWYQHYIGVIPACGSASWYVEYNFKPRVCTLSLGLLRPCTAPMRSLGLQPGPRWGGGKVLPPSLGWKAYTPWGPRAASAGQLIWDPYNKYGYTYQHYTRTLYQHYTSIIPVLYGYNAYSAGI